MLKWFKCPEGRQHYQMEIKQCLAGSLETCPNGERCCTIQLLNIIAQERIWAGVPSTTQLINGTMLEFLKLTRDYMIDPDDMAWILIGLNTHKKLDEMAKRLNIPAEVALSVDRNIIDSLEPNDSGNWTIMDYKTWGSYRVAKALGIVQVGRKPDPSGEVYKRNGPGYKVGEPKTIPVYKQVDEEADRLELELQLNNYRIKAAEVGINVTKLGAQVIVRDGNTQSAKSRGILKNMYKFSVKMLPDQYVKDFFQNREIKLLDALKAYESDKTYMPEPCSSEDRWGGNRCNNYCDVAMYCPLGPSNQNE